MLRKVCSMFWCIILYQRKPLKREIQEKPTFSYLAAILFVLDTLENVLRLVEQSKTQLAKTFMKKKTANLGWFYPNLIFLKLLNLVLPLLLKKLQDFQTYFGKKYQKHVLNFVTKNSKFSRIFYIHLYGMTDFITQIYILIIE